MKRLAASLLILLFVCSAAMAQTYYTTVDQPLSFGSFGIARNDAPYAIRIHTDGTVDDDAAIIRATPATRGEITFTDLPANIDFFIGVDNPNTPAEGGLTLDQPTDLELGGSGGYFILSNLEAVGSGGTNFLHTDGTGTGTIYIGATLTTSGTGQRFESGTYSGTFHMTIHY